MPFRMDEEQDQQQGQNGNAAPNVSGVSNTIDTNVPKGTAKAQQQGPQKSGQYQNIQQYLKANEGAGSQMGGQIAGSVEQKATEARTAGQQLANEPQKVSAYNVQDVLNKAQAGDQTKKQEYQTMKQTGGYTGPSDVTGLGGYGAYQTKGQAATENVNLAGSESGQKTLLRNIYGRPDYTAGSNTLDQALMAQSQGGRQAISDIASKYSGLTNELTGYSNQAGKNIAQSQSQAAQNKAAFQPAEQAARSAIIDPLQQKAAQTNAEQKALYERLSGDVKDLRLNPETMAMLGLKEGQRTFGTDLSKYINPATGEANIQNIASQDDLDKYNNLMNFIGANQQDLPTKAQAYQGAGVNKEALQKEILGKQAEFDKIASGAKVGIGTDKGGSMKDFLDSGLTPEQYVEKNVGKIIKSGRAASGNKVINDSLQNIKNFLAQNNINYNDQVMADKPMMAVGTRKGGLK